MLPLKSVSAVLTILIGSVSVASPADSPLVEFGLKQLTDSGFERKVDLSISTDLPEQAYKLSDDGSISLQAGDERGLMYGLLEISEQYQLNGDTAQLDQITGNPFIEKRGLKFNIPLDARCPSYDDTGDAAQRNILHMWDYSFWTEYLDQMALHRYNTLTLWSPNPFPVMIKLDDYPNITLDDVCVTTAVPKGRVGEWSNPGGVNEVVLDHLEVVKKITIDEKIAFWQKVFQYANDRGIDVYFITWNIYTNGTYGQYGLSDDIDNPANIPFYRAAIKKFLETYPQLKGIGVTAGERMHVPQGRDVADERERWLWETYGKGILDYTAENPDREVPFIHRFWYSKFEKIWKYWKDYPHHLDLSLKYITARIYSSSERSPYYNTIKEHLEKNDLKSWWNLRNDDIFVYRWGNPEYVADFFKNLPHRYTAGYHMGSDGYVWGRVFSDKSPASEDQLEIDKHWYKFMLWGRLGYDNSLDRSFFEQKLNQRFQNTNTSVLYDAWKAASNIVPEINKYMFYTGDRHWAPEGCFARESFRFVPDFRVTKSLRGSGIQNPKTFIEHQLAGTEKGDSISPLEVSQKLLALADEARQRARSLRKDTNNPELMSTLDDIVAMSWLGEYYSHKIACAVALEQFDQIKDNKQYAKSATRSINAADKAWKQYARISNRNYYPQMLSRVRDLDWNALGEHASHDKAIVKQIIANKGVLPQDSDPAQVLQLIYPFNGSKKRFGITLPSTGDYTLELYRESSLIGYYRNVAPQETDSYAWEDLLSLGKGDYTLNLIFEDKNKTLQFQR